MSVLSCNVVRDILPLYVDEVVCKDTRELVEAHLRECEACRREVEAMRRPVVLPVRGQGVQTLKQVKVRWGRKQLWRGIAIASTIAALLIGVFFWLYGYGLPVNLEDVTLHAGLQCTPGHYGEGDKAYYDTQSWVIDIGTTSGHVITTSQWQMGENRDGEKVYNAIKIYVRRSPIVFPWDYTGPIRHGMADSQNVEYTWDEDFTITVVCADQEVSYSMREEGLWDKDAVHLPEFCPNCKKGNL